MPPLDAARHRTSDPSGLLCPDSELGGGTDGAVARGVVCTLPAWAQGFGLLDAELVQRTIFAIVLALHNGTDAQVVALPAAASPQPLLRTLSLDPLKPLQDHMKCWSTWQRQTQPHAGQLGALRELIQAGTFPGFSFEGANSSQRHQLPDDLPLRCTATMTAKGLQWTLTAPGERANDGQLSAFLHQARRVIAIAGRDPSLPLTELAHAVRSADFEIQVITSGGFTDLAASLGAWGTAIGLPLKVRRIEPEEAHVGEPPTGVLQPQCWGANLAVIARRPDRTTRLQARPPGTGSTQLSGRLPDGSAIEELNANETRELIDEIFVRARYLRAGIQIHDEDVILDVGANIGIFTLFAASQAARVLVHAFEPVPAVADVLETNLRAHGVTACVERTALGHSGGRAEFTYYPFSSLQSGLYADSKADEAVARVYARQQTDRYTAHAGGLSDQISEALAPTIHQRTAHRQTLTVPIRRLSDWIRKRDIDRINLLKIDVERAEEDVLLGIDPEHWPLIDQVVVEVHDIAGRLERLAALLRAHGFETTVEQDDLFDGSEIHMLYARHPSRSHKQVPWVSRQVELAAHWARASVLPVVVTAAPGTADTELAQAREEVAAHGLVWVEPPADGASLTWAEILLRRMTALDRPVTKALVVDADNTLWGGVCGEVEPEHIDIGGPYRQVQEFLRQQQRAGRALVLCSRNNLDDLHAVFAAHPDMPLGLDDFAAVHAGWERKSRAVSAIAEDLGFATESLVFIDDSPAERTEVALQHPAMTVVDIPADPAAMLHALRATWQLALDGDTTEEDRTRARLNTQECARRAVAEQTTDFATYLRQLDLTVEVEPATEGDTDRIVQLAARTTQFNFLLRRHTSATVRHLLSGPGTALTVRVRDRFGDYGLVGFAYAEANAGVLRVRDLFLSCRALGRNVEWRLLQALGETAASAGLSALELGISPGPRNQPARAFVRTAQERFAAASSPTGALLDPAELVRADWRLTEASHPRPSPLPPAQARAPEGAPVRWPVSLDSAHHAAAARPGRQHNPATIFIAPETATEQQIAAVWEETLGVQPIGALDDLFALGCDSLTAAVICVRLRSADLHLSLEDLLHQPTVRGCARLARRATLSRGPEAVDTELDAQEQPALGQARIWAAESIQVHGNDQIIPTAHRITGPLDIERLRGAFQAVVERHPALRTVLEASSGRLQCHVMPPSAFDLEFTDLTDHPVDGRGAAAEEVGRAFFSARFDLERGPMVRCAVIRLEPAGHLLLTAAHHGACDGWSMDILHRDLSTAYSDPDALATGAASSFARYQRALRKRVERGDFRAAVGEIDSLLGPHDATSTGSTAEFGRDRGPVPHHVRFALDLPLCQRVRIVAQNRSTTPFHLYLAAYQLLTAAARSTTTLTSGIPVANRHDPAHAETVGFLANLVPLRTHIDWSATLGTHLDTAISTSTRALHHAEVPYGLLTSYRPKPGGLFDNLFTLQPPPSHPLALNSCQVNPAEPALWPQPYPMMLDLQEHHDGASALVRIDLRAHRREYADWFAEAYPLVLEALSSRPGLPLNELRGPLNPPIPGPASPADLNGQEGTRDV